MGLEVPWTAVAMMEAEQALRRRRMNRDDGQTIAGRHLPPGYSLIANEITASLDLFGPKGVLVSFERSCCLSDIADEIVAACHQDRYRRMMESGPTAPMVSVDLEEIQRMANMKSNSPAALAAMHREARQIGYVSGGHVDDSFSTLFSQLAKEGRIPSRGERFGEPHRQWSTESNMPDKVHRGPMYQVKRSAKDECREIESMGAHSWLLKRHKDFVRDVRVP